MKLPLRLDMEINLTVILTENTKFKKNDAIICFNLIIDV
jgi:hypothetical protein